MFNTLVVFKDYTSINMRIRLLPYDAPIYLFNEDTGMWRSMSDYPVTVAGWV